MGRSTVATLEDAIREAVRKHRKQHGSVIVRDGDVFEGVPMEYINYFNYSSPHEMAVEVYRICDDLQEVGYNVDEDGLLAFILETFSQGCE